MKRIVLLLLVLLLTLPAFAQVGRFKIIKVWYPGYSLKLDTATGELWAVHFDVQEDQNVEEVIFPGIQSIVPVLRNLAPVIGESIHFTRQRRKPDAFCLMI